MYSFRLFSLIVTVICHGVLNYEAMELMLSSSCIPFGVLFNEATRPEWVLAKELFMSADISKMSGTIIQTQNKLRTPRSFSNHAQ